jgi:hypothetical protein
MLILLKGLITVKMTLKVFVSLTYVSSVIQNDYIIEVKGLWVPSKVL